MGSTSADADGDGELGGLVDAAETVALAPLVRPLLAMLGELSGLEAVYFTRIDWPAGIQHIELSSNAAPESGFAVPEGIEVPWGETLCEMTLASDVPWNSEVQATWGDRGAAQALPIESYVSVPVIVGADEHPYGTLCGASPRRVPADLRTMEVLQLCSTLIATSLERDRALLRARARAEFAEDRLEGRIAFAAQVEHAMRTPLGTIAGWAETLQTHDADPALRADGLDAIKRTADRLGVQVSDLLLEARSAIGRGPAEDVDVGAVARGLRRVTPEHELAVTGELRLHADPVAVAVLVEHLVENAVAHTPPGTAIRVMLAPHELVVEDDGPGLPDRDDLFDAFVSADPQRPGTGLGLHIVQQIVERFGATMEAGASATGGARFVVRFPDAG